MIFADRYCYLFQLNGSATGNDPHDRKSSVGAYALAFASATPEVDVTRQILDNAGLNSR